MSLSALYALWDMGVAVGAYDADGADSPTPGLLPTRGEFIRGVHGEFAGAEEGFANHLSMAIVVV